MKEIRRKIRNNFSGDMSGITRKIFINFSLLFVIEFYKN